MASDKSTWHRLSEVDKEARTAVCSVCGPTSITLRSGSNKQKYRCRAKEKHHNTTSKAKKAGMLMARSYAIELEERWIQQDGKCAICSDSLELGPGNYALDHDHRTGRIRSVLCGKCNRGIGLLQDNPDVVLSAYLYLVQWEAGVEKGGTPTPAIEVWKKGSTPTI